MAEEPTCCYRVPASFGERAPCQFMAERERFGADLPFIGDHARDGLFPIGGTYFCPYHLPYSIGALKADHGIEGVADDQAATLKEHWPAAARERFNEVILAKIEAAAAARTELDLTGVVFSAGFNGSKREYPQIRFTACRFAGGPASFEGAQFSGGDAWFDGAQFSGGYVSFGGAQFSGGNARFDGAQFSGGIASFDGAQFSGGYAWFEGAQFSGGDARFIRAEFSGGAAWFEGAQFSGGDAQFDGAQFSGGGAWFNGAQFSGGDAWFAGAHFSGGGAWFNGAQFSGGDARFNGARFSGGDARFNGAQFSGGRAWFTDAQFSGGAVHFDGARFASGAYFGAPGHDADKAARTARDLAFRHTVFAGAEFGGPTTFENRTFTSETDFSGTIFRVAPKFHGATLHQDTRFPGIEGFRDTRSPHAAHAYRTLRLAMAQQKAHDEEAMFWALEQKSKRRALSLPPSLPWRRRARHWARQPRHWLPWLLSWSYEILANYGLSITRPLVWLLAMVAAQAILIYPLFKARGAETFGEYLSGRVTAALQQTFRPFWIWSESGLKDAKEALGIEGPPSAAFEVSLRLVATFDSLFSAVLILLFLLAVRRRFRMV